MGNESVLNLECTLNTHLPIWYYMYIVHVNLVTNASFLMTQYLNDLEATANYYCVATCMSMEVCIVH